MFESLILPFLGGVVGASFGGLAPLVFMGLGVFYMMVLAAAGVDAPIERINPLLSFLGPHVALVGAIGGAAFARRMGWLASGKDILRPLMSLERPSVLIVGGLFGLLGSLFFRLSNHFAGGSVDTLSLTIVVLGIVAKILFSPLGFRDIFGVVPQEVTDVGGRFSVRSPFVWLPWMANPLSRFILSVSVGCCSGYVTLSLLQSDNAGARAIAWAPGFGFALVMLLFLCIDLKVPVITHLALGGSFGAAFAVQHGLESTALLWAVVGGVLAGEAAEYLSRLLYVFGDVHVDPPSAALVVVSVLFWWGGDLVPAIVYAGGTPPAVLLVVCLGASAVWLHRFAPVSERI